MARFTMKHREELLSAIASGAQSIRFKDKEVRYHGPERLKRLLREIEDDLGISGDQGGSGNARARTPRFDNGL